MISLKVLVYKNFQWKRKIVHVQLGAFIRTYLGAFIRIYLGAFIY